MYSGSRTLANTLETSLLLLALASYPSHRALGLAALSVMVRPTAVLAWLPLAPLYCLTTLPSLPLSRLVSLPLLPLAAVILTVTVDSIYYGGFAFTPWTFFHTNVMQDVSSFFGSHPYYWYLSHALLPILGPLLLPAVLGLPRLPSLLSLPILSTLLVLSLLPHKEMRFLQPILPLLLYSAACHLAKKCQGPPSSRVTLALLLTNLPLALYLCQVHQQGVVEASLHLGCQASPALLLMPCHSTPLYSHIHRDIAVRHLSCLPPLPGEGAEEAETFYRDPVAWLEEEYPHSLPHNVVMFDSLEQEVEGWLRARGRVPCLSWFHTHFPEGRVGARVLLYCPG